MPNSTQGNVRANIPELHEVNQDPDDGMTVVPAQDIQNDTEYACPVTIGTPGETLTLDFDTGSADLWVWSSQARVSKADMEGRGIYNPKKSRTSKKLRGHTWEVRYGDGSSASGVVYLDTIVIGDITVENQAVEVARELSDDFLQAGCDGLVGLGFPRLNQVQPNRQKTPMENMIEQGVIKDPIFTVKLDKRDSRGFYTFGFIDETVHCSKFYWQDVDKQNVPSAYIKIGDEIYDRGPDNTAIIDTGTTLVLLDDETVEKLYSKIEGATYDEDQGGFSVHADRNAKYRPNGPSDYAKCIRKYRIGASQYTPFYFDEHRACNVRITSIENDPVNQDPDDGMTIIRANDIQNDTEYACPVTIGSPGVTLTLDFDTGSSDFWVWSSEFRASRAQLEGHQIYNPHKSRTAESLPGATWEIAYGDGSHASGNVVMDTITIGDITIKRQAVEVAQNLSDEFLRGGSDGLLGLAFPKLNTVRPHQQKTPMQNMVEQGLVKDPIFTVKLDKHDSRGYYTFGYINEHVHASKLYWQKVITDNGWWEVVSPYVRIGSKIYNRGRSNTAIIDTGTTLILMDDETIERLYSQIPGATLDRSLGGYIFPTNTRVPELAFCVGRWLFTVPSKDLAFSDAGNVTWKVTYSVTLQYAKSIKKYKIGATNHTPFFFDEVMALDLDSDDGMSIVQAEDIQNDSEYACPVTIGTPGVTLTLDFDTGSSDFWVWSSEFRATRAQLEGHQIYNPDKSRTAERLPGATWKISYGDGSSASGDVILDTVMIGDIKIKRQAVELSRHLSDEFLKGGSDGLLGLAFPKLNTVQPYQQKTPMQNMVEQGLVKEPIFSVKLDKHDSRGYYTFGYINEHIHASQLYWREVITDNGLWEVASPEFFVSSEEVRTTDLLGAQDTGTTLILMDDETIKHLYSQIPGAKLDRSIGGYVFPTDARVPKLAFCVGRWLFTIPSEDLAFSDAGNGMSYGAIQSRGQNKQDILGDVFLKHVYVVFDQGANPRIGVAQR
ncbi:unnamed protein product [Rhizoctonia solani]|uniref:Peptidase A1 domain-containing protein n=1 Tax=Rhizoctonia solani TaxID=456999 RepID=A0A8H3CGV4_9AGAM|nr:unnamed protein product [Rhizoctonia solani]